VVDGLRCLVERALGCGGKSPAAGSCHERPCPPERLALVLELGGQIARLRMRPGRCERLDQVAGEQELPGLAVSRGARVLAGCAQGDRCLRHLTDGQLEEPERREVADRRRRRTQLPGQCEALVGRSARAVDVAERRSRKRLRRAELGHHELLTGLECHVVSLCCVLLGKAKVARPELELSEPEEELRQ
jgi:hypothetical protein